MDPSNNDEAVEIVIESEDGLEQPLHSTDHDNEREHLAIADTHSRVHEQHEQQQHGVGDAVPVEPTLAAPVEVPIDTAPLMDGATHRELEHDEMLHLARATAVRGVVGEDDIPDDVAAELDAADRDFVMNNMQYADAGAEVNNGEGELLLTAQILGFWKYERLALVDGELARDEAGLLD